ncbi:MAG TPA: riboflavin synthase [Mycobacteriales bacterium]|nr:riboflavin synthase [Mycobacteriales bacterium]
MFTGIIEALGRVTALEPLPDAVRLSIASPVLDDVRPGDSVAVNGVCLTAADVSAGGFTADVMQETLRRSTLGALAADEAVNLERAVTPTTRLGGHIVQGHIDGVATVAARRPSEHWDEVDVTLPDELAPYVVAKGSVALDGVSLTVAAVAGSAITVCLIPETLQRTTLGRRGPGSALNVEVDILAKYVERALATRGTDG